MSVDALQRLVVRMSMDPAFADAVREGRAALDLSAESREWVCAVDARAWGAERGRAEQMLGNLAGELPLSSALAAPGVVEGFAGAAEFHQAVDRAESLPLAFAAWLERHATAGSLPLTRLEAELVRARRVRPPRPAAPVRLALGVRLVSLPAGTVDLASAIHAARAAGRPWPQAQPNAAVEWVVLAPRSNRRWTVPDVHVEVVDGGVAALLRRAASGMHLAEFAAFADACEVEVSEVRGLIGALAEEGILDPGAVDV